MDIDMPVGTMWLSPIKLKVSVEGKINMQGGGPVGSLSSKVFIMGIGDGSVRLLVVTEISH